ncbi:MAG: hypothetical protein ACLQVM_11970 [Terriglobia bacterium]
MSPGAFDSEALIRAFSLSLAAGFVVAAVGYFVMRPRVYWAQKKPALIFGVVGVMLFLTLGAYYTWPSLVEVPALDNHAQAEAEDLLAKRHLIPEIRPQQAAGVEAGRVVPYSQNPAHGLRVHTGSVVSFGVSVSQGGPSLPATPVAAAPMLSLFEPKSGETLRFAPGGEGLYRCSVRGTSSGLASGFQLLLWLKPVRPPSETFGWYLQRSGNGISSVESDGTWAGVVQLGNAQYPPHEGDIIDLAVSVADDATASKLMGEQGVVTRDHPIGVRSAIASNIVVTMK